MDFFCPKLGGPKLGSWGGAQGPPANSSAPGKGLGALEGGIDGPDPRLRAGRSERVQERGHRAWLPGSWRLDAIRCPGPAQHGRVPVTAVTPLALAHRGHGCAPYDAVIPLLASQTARRQPRAKSGNPREILGIICRGEERSRMRARAVKTAPDVRWGDAVRTGPYFPGSIRRRRSGGSPASQPIVLRALDSHLNRRKKEKGSNYEIPISSFEHFTVRKLILQPK